MKRAVEDLGLKQVPLKPDASANGCVLALARAGLLRRCGRRQSAAAQSTSSMLPLTTPSMTAAYLPDGIEIPAVVGPMLKKGVVIAAGLHKDIKTRYIRFGHVRS